MKRYIRTSTSSDIVDKSLFAGTPFTWKKASGYEDYLNPDKVDYYKNNKNRVGKIVMMTPTEYVNECVKFFKNRSSFQELIDQRTDDYLPQYEEAMRNGDKFPLCYIDYTYGQEGLHRMIAAGNVFGWDTEFPVLVVTVYDQDKENLWKSIDGYKDFIKYGDFKKVCWQAEDDYLEYNVPLPNDFTEGFRKAVINAARNYEDGYDIDVVVKLGVKDGKHMAYVYLTRFEYYIVSEDNLDDPYDIVLDYIYDFGEDTYRYDPKADIEEFNQQYDEAIRQAEEQGIDLNDYDSLMKFFLKD